MGIGVTWVWRLGHGLGFVPSLVHECTALVGPRVSCIGQCRL